MASVIPLPVDVLALILDHFDLRRLDRNASLFRESAWDCHRTLLSLSATSQQFRFVSLPLLRQTRWFQPNDLASKDDVLALFDAHDRREAIRHVFIDTLGWKLVAPISRGRNSNATFAEILTERPALGRKFEALSTCAEKTLSCWADDLAAGSKSAWMAFLLSCLPHLEMLHVRADLGQMGYASSTRALWSFMAMHTANPDLLPNLKDLHVDGPGTMTFSKIAYYQLDGIFGLPSLRSLHMHPAELAIFASKLHWRSEWGSQLTHLQLRGTCVTEELMDWVSKVMIKLEHFHYKQAYTFCDQSYARENATVCGPQYIVDALSNSQARLKTLIVEGWTHDCDQQLRKIRSFGKIDNLERFEITPILVALDEQDQELEESDWLELCPSGLKTLVLQHPQAQNTRGCLRWLCGFIEHWNRCCSSLRKVDISQWPIGVAMHERCKGIAFKIRRDPSLRDKLLLPLWFDSAFDYILKS